MKDKLAFFSVVGVTAASLAGSASASAQQQAQELSGDPKLACEAILCLSSGTRPGECRPSLSRYFGIKHKYWRDTFRGRMNFLKQCPTAHDTSSADMPQIVENIVNGAGRCDANTLNATLRQVVQKKTCPSDCFQRGRNNWWVNSGRDWTPPGIGWTPLDDGTGCYVKNVVVISQSKPGYCSAYADGRYTYQLGVRYVGDPTEGGHWVNDSAGP